MITSQAATVLAAFRHLKGIVSVLAPDRLSDVMSNIATAAVNLNPQVVMQVMQTQEDPVDQGAVVTGMTAAFDDVRVAQLLSTALASLERWDTWLPLPKGERRDEGGLLKQLECRCPTAAGCPIAPGKKLRDARPLPR